MKESIFTISGKGSWGKYKKHPLNVLVNNIKEMIDDANRQQKKRKLVDHFWKATKLNVFMMAHMNV